MDIVRNPDGTLVVPLSEDRHHDDRDDADTVDDGADAPAAPTTRVLHPGEGGYDEALAEWDIQQNPDREPAVSTATGRQEAMSLVHRTFGGRHPDLPFPQLRRSLSTLVDFVRHMSSGLSQGKCERPINQGEQSNERAA